MTTSHLIVIVNYLSAQLAQQREGTHPTLRSFANGLLYVGRVAAYAMRMYPYERTINVQVKLLLNAFHRIHHTATAWRIGERVGDGQTELAIIEQTLQAGLADVTRALNDTAEV